MTRPDQNCDTCGAANAPYGLGPPLTPTPLWYCAPHWQRLPAAQAMLADRANDVGDQERPRPVLKPKYGGE